MRKDIYSVYLTKVQLASCCVCCVSECSFSVVLLGCFRFKWQNSLNYYPSFCNSYLNVLKLCIVSLSLFPRGRQTHEYVDRHTLGKWLTTSCLEYSGWTSTTGPVCQRRVKHVLNMSGDFWKKKTKKTEGRMHIFRFHSHSKDSWVFSHGWMPAWQRDANTEVFKKFMQSPHVDNLKWLYQIKEIAVSHTCWLVCICVCASVSNAAASSVAVQSQRKWADQSTSLWTGKRGVGKEMTPGEKQKGIWS